jgi:N-acetylglucosamine-6-phosphate deacetylase
MYIKTISYSLLMLFSICGCTENKEAEGIEGLLYLDGKPVRIEVVDGKIASVRTISPGGGIPLVYVAPGLIDIQINGYMGIDFSDQNLTVEDMQKATNALYKEGVTSYLPTVVTQDQERLLKSFSILAGALDDNPLGKSIPGFHLEGPYISPVKGFRGAHNEKYIRQPEWQEFQELQNAAQNRIILITVAPEIEGAIPFIKKCRESGVLVSLGHHNGTPDNIDQAVDAGASLSTHLGNGCANMINRHHNPIWPQLSNDGLSITIIADGAHLTRDEVRTFYKVKGNKQTILVSDALFLAGLPPGEYIDDGDTLLLTKNVVKFPAEDVLVGAVQPVSRGVGNIMRYTNCSLKDAIQMASTNPAKMMGLSEIGEIKEGQRADLILFTLEDGDMLIHKTIVAGEVVYSKE